MAGGGTAGGDSLKGFLLALMAYLIWGGLPLYLNMMRHIPVTEVLAQRIVWSVPIALAVLWVLGRTRDLRVAMRTPRLLAMAGLTAALVTVNWGIYLYAVLVGQTLDAALGYFINPLFSVLLGALVLREKLSRPQWAAVALAGSAVALLTIEAGELPLVSLSLTLTWGLYALAKRALPIGPNQGFTLEVLILTPAALAWIFWQASQGRLLFGTTGWADVLLLLGAGALTAIPLMLYANGAKMLRLSTIGIMQYIAPSFVFLIAVFIFDEPFDGAKPIAFPMIWAALALYTLDMLRRR